MSNVFDQLSVQSGVLVPVACSVRNHVRNSLLFHPQIHPEQSKGHFRLACFSKMSFTLVLEGIFCQESELKSMFLYVSDG